MRILVRISLCLFLTAMAVAVGNGQSILIDTYTQRGKMAFEGGDLKAAEQLFKSALAEAEKIGDQEQIATCSVNLGKVYLDEEKFDPAEKLFLRAVNIFENVDGKDTERAAYALNNLGLLYAEKKDFPKSEEYLRRTLTIREKLFGKDDPDLAVTLLNLGKLYADQSKFTEADASVIASARSLADPLFDANPMSAMPVFSSGQTVRQAAGTWAALGHPDLIHAAGGGIMAHPQGAAAGVTAFREAWTAAMADIPIDAHARSHPALAAALETFR